MASCPRRFRLRRHGQERCAGRCAGGRAGGNEQWLAARCHARRSDGPLRCDTRTTGVGWQWTPCDYPRRGKRRRRLSAHEHARVRRGRVRAPAVDTLDCGANVQKESWHQITVSAPLLMFTFGPSNSIDAPFPFEMVMPRSLIRIEAPEATLIEIPPVGPGRSDSTI